MPDIDPFELPPVEQPETRYSEGDGVPPAGPEAPTPVLPVDDDNFVGDKGCGCAVLGS